MRESCCIQPTDEWVERRRRDWDEHITRMDAERLFKITISAGKRSPGCQKRRWEDLGEGFS